MLYSTIPKKAEYNPHSHDTVIHVSCETMISDRLVLLATVEL